MEENSITTYVNRQRTQDQPAGIIARIVPVNHYRSQ